MSKLSSKNGHVFHVTSTGAVIALNDVKIVNEGAKRILLSVYTDGWSGGKNITTLKASKQTLTGAVEVGSGSTLDLEFSDGSSFEGSMDGEISNAKGESASTKVGTVSVTLDDTSTWTLDADNYISSLNRSAADVTTSGHALYVDDVALTGTKWRSDREAETSAIANTKVYEKKDGPPQFGGTAFLTELFSHYESLGALSSPAEAVRSCAYKAEFLPEGEQIGPVVIDHVDMNARSTTASS